MVNIEVITESGLEFYVKFKTRIAILTGLSGIGKSTFVDLLTSQSSVKASVTVNDEKYSWRVVQSNWMDTIKVVERTVIVMDEDYSHILNTTEFTHSIDDFINKDNYILIINRASDIFNYKDYKSISYHVKDILTFSLSTDGKIHETVPIYPDYKISLDYKPDIVLLEDSNSGYKWFNQLFSNTDITVLSVRDGKSAIVKYLDKVVKTDHKNILIVFDSCAYGCYMQEFFIKRELYNSNFNYRIEYLSDYESFEELLLRTNLFRFNLTCVNNIDDTKYLNNHKSWEIAYYELLKYISKDSQLSYGKSTLRKCYYKDCADCRSIEYKPCPYYIEGSKIDKILYDTKYEYLLNLRDKQNVINDFIDNETNLF